MERATFKTMKMKNRNLVLNYIRVHSGISRADIAQQSGLTPPTVSSIAKSLLDENIIFESIAGESKGGRKPRLLKMNDDENKVIGVYIGPKTVETVITNLRGEVDDTFVDEINRTISKEELEKLIAKNIQRITESPHQYLGIGIAMHGFVDVENHTSLYAPLLLNIKDFDFSFLEDTFGLPIHVENDVRCKLWAEVSRVKPHHKNILYINLGYGVGGAIMIDNQLYNGSHNIAGELGHTIIEMNGRQCECGRRGCLQAYVSGLSLTNIARDKNIIGEEETVKELLVKADNDNHEAQNEIVKIGMYLGTAISNQMNVLDPDLIILGGGVSNLYPYFKESLYKTLKNEGDISNFGQAEIKIGEIQKSTAPQGAALLVLDKIFT